MMLLNEKEKRQVSGSRCICSNLAYGVGNTNERITKDNICYKRCCLEENAQYYRLDPPGIAVNCATRATTTVEYESRKLLDDLNFVPIRDVLPLLPIC